MRAPTTANDLDRLEALAERATPGPWQHGIDEVDDIIVRAPSKALNTTLAIMVQVVGHPSDQPNADAAYIAACDPDTIRQLVAIARASSS